MRQPATNPASVHTRRLFHSPPVWACRWIRSSLLGRRPTSPKRLSAKPGVALVAWEHKAIARDLLPAITDHKSLPGMPTKWDGTRFDVVLRFDRTSPEAPWSFRQLCPCLLSEIGR